MMKNVILVITILSGSFCSCRNIENQETKDSKIDAQMNENKSFFITDKNNNKHQVFKVSAEDLHKYITDKKAFFCDSIYKKFNVTAYQLLDGRVIVEESGKYAMYPSLEILSSVLKEHTGPYKREILFGKKLYGENFPSMITKLIDELNKNLGVTTSSVDRKEVFHVFDSIVTKNRTQSFVDKHLLSFVALIGDFVIKEFHGKWKMTLGDDKETWNPFIEIGNKKVYFVDYIIEDFLNPKQNRPVTEVFETVKLIIQSNILR